MGHNHNHRGTSYNSAFAVGIALNVVFVGAEAGFGIYAGSLALIADAGHNLSDVFSLFMAWGAALLASRASTEKRTYGYRKLTIMASLGSAVLLLVALGGITWEAIGRFANPAPVEGPIVITVAVIGVLINSATALLFLSGQKHDLNIRAAFVHMAADAGVSVGVAISGLLIMLKGWLWIDPVISLVIAVIILLGTWGLLRDSGNLAIDAVPAGIDMTGIRQYLNRIDAVTDVHDLHVWAMSTTENALTVHLVVKNPVDTNRILGKIQSHLRDSFNIEHATIQIESRDSDYECMLDNHSCP